MSNLPQISLAQLELLLKMAGKQLHIDPQELRRQLESGDLRAVSTGLSGQAGQQLTFCCPTRRRSNNCSASLTFKNFCKPFGSCLSARFQKGGTALSQNENSNELGSAISQLLSDPQKVQQLQQMASSLGPGAAQPSDAACPSNPSSAPQNSTNLSPSGRWVFINRRILSPIPTNLLILSVSHAALFSNQSRCGALRVASSAFRIARQKGG